MLPLPSLSFLFLFLSGKPPLLSTDDDISLLMQCILWDNDLKGTKHELKEMIMHYATLESPEGKSLYKYKNLADLS